MVFRGMPALPGLQQTWALRYTSIACWIVLLAAVYLATRFYAVHHIPIFIDEALQVDRARATPESAPIPNAGYNGKWLTIKLFALAITLPLPFDDFIAARLTTVIFGLSTAVACYLIARDLFADDKHVSVRADHEIGKATPSLPGDPVFRLNTGILSVMLYTVLPFSVIYTSLALADGIQVAFSTWVILLSIRLARSPKWCYVIGLVLVLTSAILAKFSAFFMIAVPVIAILILIPPSRWPAACLRAAPALLTALGLLAFLYRRGLLSTAQDKMISSPTMFIAQLGSNLILAGSWLWGLLTPTIVLLTVAAVYWLMVWERRRAGFFLAALLGLAILPYTVVSETWYPRYLLFAVVPVVLAVSRLLIHVAAIIDRRLKHRRTVAVPTLALGITAVFAWPVVNSGFILTALPQANLPAEEHAQFVTGWASGYGVPELVTFLREQSEMTPGGITIARLDLWDHPFQTLNVYLSPSPTLSLYTITQKDKDAVAKLAMVSASRRTLLVFSTAHGLPRSFPEAVAPLLTCSTEIWAYTRSGAQTGLAVHELDCGNLAASLHTP